MNIRENVQGSDEIQDLWKAQLNVIEVKALYQTMILKLLSLLKEKDAYSTNLITCAQMSHCT